MKYIMRSYIERRWYVENFLLPSMYNQGIKPEDIEVFEDDGTLGNLMGFVYVMDYIAKNHDPNEGLWHIQDDIVICKNFAEINQNANPKFLTCGFASSLGDGYEKVKKTGWQTMNNSWMSFQAVLIPNKYCAHFVKWFNDRVVKGGLFRKRYALNKPDDFFFHWFITHEYPDDLAYNMCPNIVNHVDNIVGAYCNPQNTGKNISYYWLEDDLISQLRKDVNEFRKDPSKWQDRESR